LLRFTSGEDFATGALRYLYQKGTEHDVFPRIIIPVEINSFPVNAIVDTGAPFVVCPPELAEVLALVPDKAIEAFPGMVIRGRRFSGYLHEVSIRFRAEAGRDEIVFGTTFVPDEATGIYWGGWPPFIGLTGCLERLRFAVDPNTDTFYFGSLGNG
jgi:hypothetical protein